jgi:hypothetical protein
MEHKQNRRNFLRNAVVATGLSQLPMIGWAEGFSTLLSQGINPAGEFSLLKLEKLLPGYTIPPSGNFSTGTFESSYNLFNLYGNNAVNAGDFTLISTGKGESRYFEFTSTRVANAGTKEKGKSFQYVVSGNVICKNNATLSPEKWKVDSRISADGSAFHGTGLVNQGTVKQGEIILDFGARKIRKSIDSQILSWKWGLISVAQKMAEESVAELQFSMLDEFDLLYRNQKLKFKKRVMLDCGTGQPIEFKVFELTGDGVIPTVYWVDNRNRTLFVITGMEAYVLDNHSASTKTVPTERMQQVYEEVKTPFKYGIVIRGEEGQVVDCASIFKKQNTNA